MDNVCLMDQSITCSFGGGGDEGIHKEFSCDILYPKPE